MSIAINKPREPNGRLQRPSTAKSQADATRKREEAALRHIIHNPSRKGYTGERAGAAGEACIIYQQAFSLAQRLVSAGGDVEDRLLYDAYSAMCRLWDSYRRAAGLDTGHDVRFHESIGGDGIASDIDPASIMATIVKAEGAIADIVKGPEGKRAAFIIRACTESIQARGDLHQMSGPDTVTLIAGLYALTVHFKMAR